MKATRCTPSTSFASRKVRTTYPAIKPPGDLDIGVDDGVGDEEYMQLLHEHLPGVLEEHRPQLILYLAGADPYEADQLGGLGLSLEGLRGLPSTVAR